MMSSLPRGKLWPVRRVIRTSPRRRVTLDHLGLDTPSLQNRYPAAASATTRLPAGTPAVLLLLSPALILIQWLAPGGWEPPGDVLID